MASIEEDRETIACMGDGESHYFNMFQDGGAVCYLCNGIYLLFEVPLYGGTEDYRATFQWNEIDELIKEASSWT